MMDRSPRDHAAGLVHEWLVAGRVPEIPAWAGIPQRGLVTEIVLGTVRRYGCSPLVGPGSRRLNGWWG